MEFLPANSASVAIFCLILLTVLGALVWAIQHAYRSFKITALFALMLGIWLGAQSALVASGRLSTLPLNGLPFIFGPILLLWTGLAFSPVGHLVLTRALWSKASSQVGPVFDRPRS